MELIFVQMTHKWAPMSYHTNINQVNFLLFFFSPCSLEGILLLLLHIVVSEYRESDLKSGHQSLTPSSLISSDLC